MTEVEPPYLDRVRAATDEASAHAAYFGVLDAIGHNHSGTLRAGAEHAVQPLIRIALAGPGWPANAALDALTDMIGSFTPALDADPSLKIRMRATVESHRDAVIELSRGNDLFGTAQRAADLLRELGDALS